MLAPVRPLAAGLLLATGFASAVGIIFGLYPAWRASNLRPIDALRFSSCYGYVMA